MLSNLVQQTQSFVRPLETDLKQFQSNFTNLIMSLQNEIRLCSATSEYCSEVQQIFARFIDSTVNFDLVSDVDGRVI